MFKFKRNPFKTQQNPRGGWLGHDDRLFTLKLKQVENPFDPTALWVSQYGGGRDIVESVTGASDKRLQAALDCHRCSVVRKNPLGWKTRHAMVFGDVAVWINDAVWRRDAQKGGPGAETLEDNLVRLHEEHFGAVLAQDRKPSYVIMPDSALSPDAVVFQFGLGVFIPHAEDRLKAEIYLQIKDQTGWAPLPAWMFRRDTELIERTAGIYQGQQFLIIGPGFQLRSLNQVSGAQPVWFDHGQGFIFINLSSKSRANAFGDGEFVSDGEFTSYEISGKSTVYAFRDLTGTDRQLLLKISDTTVQKAQPTEPDAFDDDLEVSMDWGGDTFVAGIETDRLVIEGVALPRFDAPGLKMPNLEGWTIWIDAYGQPVRDSFSDSAEKEKLLSLTASSDENYLSYRKPGDNVLTRVNDYPLCFTDFHGRSFEVAPSPVPERYHGVLQLSDPVFEPLGQDPVVVGRPAPARFESSADIQLRLLMHPESLAFRRGYQRTGAPLGAIWLSREHVKVCVQDGQLHVRMDKGSMPVFGIRADGELKWTLQPGDKEETVLESGERMLIGCYLIRFERG